ncbi:unnamed protein product [Orchesella dallaii]|uniref:Crossover junction endonuclease EME1 n=1 Tax=Orchesella dallaii TaxID=48710 RepID=A0ABP1Q923_9HEXA
MSSSDDDVIEVLGEVSNNYSSGAKSKSNSNGQPLYTLSDDEDELLDIDDLIQLDSGLGLSSRSYKSKTTRSTSKTTTPNKPAVKKPKIRSTYNSDLDEGVGDQAKVGTELEDGREDDLDSLPSISSRASSSCQVVSSSGSGRMRTHYDNCVIDDDEDEDQKSASTVKSRKSTETYPDRETQDIDDFFQDAAYSSLADYLADVERERNKKTVTSASSNLLSGTCGTSSVFSKASSLSGSSSIPSSSTFAAPTSSKAKPKTVAPKPKEVEKSTVRLSSENISDDKTKPAVGGYQIKFTKERGKKVAAPKKVTAPKEVETNELPKSDPVLKPKAGEGFKMIVLQIAEEVMSDPLAAKFVEKEVQFKIVEQPQLANSIFFERNQHIKVHGYDSKVQVKVRTSLDEFFMVVFNVEKGLELLQSEIQKSEGLECTHQCLTDWVKGIKKKHPDKQLTLLVHGFESYIKKVQKRVQKEYRDRVLKGDKAAAGDKTKKKRKVDPSKEPIQLTRNEIQSAFIRLQLQTGINYRCFENASDLCNLLFQYAKSIGDAPFKKEKMNSMEFDWYAVSDCVGGIPVEDDGKGMRSLWLSQLSQFPGVGQESAIAIARVYGSPRELYQAYRRCSCADEGISMLTNIKVTMGVGPLAKSRRLGPEASKKIYRFFTATNGDRYVTT